MEKDHLRFSGPARCFDSEEECFDAVAEPSVQGRRGSRHPLRRPEGRSRACARCCPPPPRSTARAWATRLRSSPTAASRARRAVSASAMSARKLPLAVPSALIEDGDTIDHRRGKGHHRPRSRRGHARKAPQGLEAARDHVRLRRALKYARQVGPRPQRRGHASQRQGGEARLRGYLIAGASVPPAPGGGSTKFEQSEEFFGAGELQLAPPPRNLPR